MAGTKKAKTSADSHAAADAVPMPRPATFDEAVVEVSRFAQHAALWADDRAAAGPALRTIHVALRALRGERNFSTDALKELSDIIAGRGQGPDIRPKLRRAVELVARRAYYVKKYGRHAPAVEGPGLCRDLKHEFPRDFSSLTDTQCILALAKWTDEKPAKGQRSTNGVAVELIIAASAFGLGNTSRGELMKIVNRAVKEGH